MQQLDFWYIRLDTLPVGPSEDESEPAPIPGLVLLAAAGAAVGAKAIHSKQKENE